MFLALAKGVASADIINVLNAVDTSLSNETFICGDIVERSSKAIGRLLGFESVDMQEFIQQVKRYV